MEVDREPQQRSFTYSVAAAMKVPAPPPVPGRATSCSTPHQFSICVSACACRNLPHRSAWLTQPGLHQNGPKQQVKAGKDSL